MMYDLLINIFSGFLGSLITVGVATVVFLARKSKFSGWTVEVRRGEEILCCRPVGRRKTEEILDDSSTLSVYLKGLVSPFGWLNEDLLSQKAADSGLFRTQYANKKWVVDLSKNPQKKK